MSRFQRHTLQSTITSERTAIIHLATEKGARAMSHNMAVFCPSLARKITPITYAATRQTKEWPRALYIFTDMERASEEELEIAELLHKSFKSRPDAFKVLNHPTQHLGRYDLLRGLHKKGANDFNVYFLDELPSVIRYPVFLRFAREHTGPQTELLKTRDQVIRESEKIIETGCDPHELLAAEYIDTSDNNGIFKKYSANCIGDAILPSHVFASEDWFVKQRTNINVRALRKEEYEFMSTNPHEQAVREVFQFANLDYGRIDYSMVDGRMQVWEINDNPQACSKLAGIWRGRFKNNTRALKLMEQEFDKLTSSIEAGPPISFSSL